jgi:hypothetical protein
MPLPVVPPSLAGLDPSAVITAYAAMAARLLSRLQARLNANPAAGAPLMPGYNTTMGVWNALPAQVRAADLRNQLSMAVARINNLEQAVDAAIPPPPVAPLPAPAPLGAPAFALLTQAVNLAVNLQVPLNSAAGGNVIAGLFGGANVDAVRAQFTQISATLQGHLDATDPNAAGAVRGFVPDPSLPATMAALARGSGPGSYISVSLPAIAPGTPPGQLAPTLIHECSHTLANNPTVDFAYRDQGAFYHLSPDLALLNAPHYEQVAVQYLNPGPPIPVGATVTDIAAAALRSKVVRAWVRAYELQSKADADRADVGDLLRAREAQVGRAVSNLLFADLAKTLDTLMNPVVGGNLVIASGPGAVPGLVMTPAMTTITIAAAPSPIPAARDAINLLCQHQAALAVTILPIPALYTFINGIQDYDRPALRPLLARYYASLR